MTAKTESQLMQEISDEIDTLMNKFKANETSLAAALVTIDALVVTLDAAVDVMVLDVGSAAGVSLTADLVVLETEAGTMLTAS